MHSLRRRLTLTHTLVALLAVILVALLASQLIVRAYRDLSRQQAQLYSEGVSNYLGQYFVRNRGWRTAARDLQQIIRDQPFPDDRRIIVLNALDRVVFDSAGMLQAGERLPVLLRREPNAAIQLGPRIVGRVFVPIDSDNQSAIEQDFIRNITRIVLVGSSVAGGVALLVALLVSGQVTKPLRELTQATRRLAAGEDHQPLVVPAKARGELAEVARAFNSMADKLAYQEALRRQLVADIAHELRTPLSVLRLQIESIEDGIEQPTPQVLASLSHEVGLLSRLIDDLRLLSLADAGQLSLTLEALDPQAVLERAAAAAVNRARQQGIELRVEPSGALPAIRADAQRLAQILGNLLENALRYTPKGGRVTLRAQLSPVIETSHPAPARLVLLEVADTGPGIASADLPQIFERFYRSDRARTRETGGSGLGLAIVQRLVEAQGGQVSVTSALGQGTTFYVALPTA